MPDALPNPTPPTGTVTLMFTDIEGSSGLWDRLQMRFQPILDTHNRLLRDVFTRWGGYEVKTQGDSFLVAFGSAIDAVRCVVDMQHALAGHQWPEETGRIWVRMGMHTGEPLVCSDIRGRVDYYGPPVNRAARVSDTGHGGQIVVSAATYDAVCAEVPDHWIDHGIHRLKGLVEPERLYELRDPTLPPRDFPPLRTLAAKRTNLPESPGPLIGREEELARLQEVIGREDCRLVTLTGFGGVGKSRLALAALEQVAASSTHEVWWIALAETRTVDGLFQRLAHELGVSLEASGSVEAQVLEYLADRPMLLMLDSVEQIAEGPAAINRLLQGCRQVRCLVATRQALGLSQERLIEILPLGVEACVELFLERARRVQPDLQPTDEMRRSIAELVAQLEGIPLAVELAATRVVGMSPADMLRRLGKRFQLLQSQAPDLPPRQRALRAAIDWSYELLSPDEQTLFAELSLFRGGFTLEAAESVCDRFDVFEGVLSLRRNSLLLSEQQADQQTRFRMLETVRAYAAERLAQSDAHDDELHRRHAEYYAELAEEQAAQIRTPREGAAFANLGKELENLRTGADWAQEEGKRLLAARLTRSLCEILYRLGFWKEAQERLAAAIAAISIETGMKARRVEADLRHSLASVADDRGDQATAVREIEAALKLRREVADPAATARTLNLFASIGAEAIDGCDAKQCLEEALSLVPFDDHAWLGVIHHNLGFLAYQTERWSDAHSCYATALTHRRTAGDLRGEAETLLNLGVLEKEQGLPEQARGHYLEALRLTELTEDRMGLAFLLFNLAEIAEESGEAAAAIALYRHSEEIFADLGSPLRTHPREALDRLHASEQPPLPSWQETVARWRDA